MSCLTTSATRTSRIVWRTVRSASAAASSHESLLVPITSMTLYTLMTTLLDAVNPTPPVRRRPVNHQRADGLRDGARSVITVHDARSEGRQADGDVLRPAAGRAVTHPFARPGVHALAGRDRHPAAIELDDQGSPQHDRELVELRPLPRLGPAGRAAHVGDAERGFTRAGPSHVLVDQLRRVNRSSHPARLADQLRHARQYPAGHIALAHLGRWSSAAPRSRRGPASGGGRPPPRTRPFPRTGAPPPGKAAPPVPRAGPG